LGRKVAGSGGQLLRPLLDDISQLLAQPSPQLANEYQQLAAAVTLLETVTKQILSQLQHDENLINSVAVEYLHLVGYVCYGYMWLRMAAAAEPLQSERPQLASKAKTARFYFARILPRIHSLAATIADGSSSLYAHELGDF
jgi:hypothetical protein